MSGGSRKRTSAKDEPPPPAVPEATFQPFMPGFEQLIAQQLSQGFGGTPQSYTDSFGQFYKPINIPGYPPPDTGKK